MVFDLRGPWDDQTSGSTSKLNWQVCISGLGDDLAGLDKLKYTLIKCTVTGSGLTKDHVYQSSTDGTSWIDISGTASHTHSGTSDGGSFLDVFRANPKFIDTGSYFMFNPDKAKWNETVSSTGSTINDTDGTTSEQSIKLLTGATSGSGATIGMTGFKLDFSKPSQFQTKLKLSATTALALKAGVNCETATAADDNTVKYEAQVCTVTNANWNLRTASGSNKSESDTGTAFTTSQTSIRLEHFPDIATPKVDFYLNTAAAFTKTSDIPVAGSTGVTTLMKFSLKNSATADKNAFMYGCRLRYTTNDVWY